MSRGEIWTVAGDYTGTRRPAVVIQDDRFDALQSVTICGFTISPIEAPIFRIAVEPTEQNGLAVLSRIMVNKVSTIPHSRLRERIGQLSAEDLVRLNRGIAVFLGLAASPRRSQAN